MTNIQLPWGAPNFSYEHNITNTPQRQDKRTGRNKLFTPSKCCNQNQTSPYSKNYSKKENN